MSLSHFDEKSGIVACTTPWGKWWQTVTEVFVDVNVPEGTRAKECKVVIKTKHIECRVKGELIFQGELFGNIVVDDSTWTLEEQKRISILLAKVEKFTSDNLWESLLSDDYAPDAWTREEMLKKLDLEKFQIENGSGEGDESNAEDKDDAESVASKSDNEEEVEEEEAETQEQTADRSSEVSSPPQSPHSVDGGNSEDEVHISENEESNHGSDVEESKNERESEASDRGEESEIEEEKIEKEANDSENEGEEVPEINIQSEDEENEEKVGSDAEADVSKNSDDENEADVSKNSDDENEADVSKNSDDENEAEEVDGDLETSANAEDEAEDKASHHEADSDEEAVAKKDAHKSDDEEDNVDSDEEKSPKKKKVASNIFGESDEEENEEDNDEGSKAIKKRKKRRAQIASDSEDEGEKSEAEAEPMDVDTKRKEEEEEADSDKESEKEIDEREGSEPEVDKEADEEVQEPEEKPSSSSKKKKKDAISDDDSDEGLGKSQPDFISDFDLMMQKKKENSKRRKRRDVDIINDSDDLIADIIAQMRQAADEDRMLNKMKKTATKKLKILPLVMSQLKKHDLKMAFLDQGVLNVMADWLAPLPDRSLPNLQIREGMIKQLDEFPSIDQSLLKSSGVGRALMYLYKHPKETKENKERAGKLITEWARPIFNVTTNYHSLTKEEREQRDYDHIPKKRKVKDQQEERDTPERKDIEKALNEGDRKVRPGEKGWVGRARVPMPSNRDYVNRPKWNVEMEMGRAPSKKQATRLEKHLRSIQEKKRLSKCQRAVTISIEGRKMAI